jgi:hypothetical protein
VLKWTRCHLDRLGSCENEETTLSFRAKCSNQRLTRRKNKAHSCHEGNRNKTHSLSAQADALASQRYRCHINDTLFSAATSAGGESESRSHRFFNYLIVFRSDVAFVPTLQVLASEVAGTPISAPENSELTNNNNNNTTKTSSSFTSDAGSQNKV